MIKVGFGLEEICIPTQSKGSHRRQTWHSPIVFGFHLHQGFQWRPRLAWSKFHGRTLEMDNRRGISTAKIHSYRLFPHLSLVYILQEQHAFHLCPFEKQNGSWWGSVFPQTTRQTHWYLQRFVTRRGSKPVFWNNKHISPQQRLPFGPRKHLYLQTFVTK